MKCIIPLAGPDIDTEKFGLKPSFEINGVPLLIKAIHSRDWYGKSLFEEDLIFIIRDFEFIDDLQKLINDNFPNGKQVVIPELTCGALMSSIAGVSLIKDFNETIVIDLVDILFESQFDPEKTFEINRSCVGLIPFFLSSNSQYSYLLINEKSNVIKAKEKRIISENASAGVYFYRNIGSFLNATIYSINNYNNISYNELLYLCPSFNGLVNDGRIVKAVEVKKVNPVSNYFKVV